MKNSIAILTLLSAVSAFAVDPVPPKTPSQEKVEEIQNKGGALKVEKKPIKLAPATMEPMEEQNPEDKAIPPAQQKKMKKEKIKSH